MGAQNQPTQGKGLPLAIVVLGCTVRSGLPGSALTRRLEAARRASIERPALPVIMSGGRLWDGHAEATVMASWWQEHGPTTNVHLERISQTTRQNAAEVARHCEAMGYVHVVLVTCDFHMPRARRLFEERGLFVTPFPAEQERTWAEHLRLRFREWGAERLGRWEGLVKW